MLTLVRLSLCYVYVTYKKDISYEIVWYFQKVRIYTKNNLKRVIYIQCKEFFDIRNNLISFYILFYF